MILIPVASAFIPPGTQSYVSPPRNRPTIVRERTAQSISSLLAAGQKPPPKDEDDAEAQKDERRKEPTKKMTLVEYAEKEQKATRELNNRLLLPDRIGKAVNVTLYAFVILGFILNLFGFAYVRKPDGSLIIDTIEARRFQDEINRTVTKPGGRKDMPNASE
jgi:hypothetical protein